MSSIKRSAVAWLAVGAISFPPSGVSNDRGTLGFDEAAFDRFMESHMKNTGIPGISVAITNGSSIVLVKGYGRDGSGAPMTAHTPMFIGSLSKSFTATAVMQLVESELVELDAPVSKYLPEFQLDDARYSRITVRQLLNQSSGMADRGYFEWTRPGPSSLREAMKSIRSSSLVAEPGAEFNYHNPNYEVAARLVEVVSKQDFSSYLQKNIFSPLGMKDSYAVNRLDDSESRTLQGHVFVFGRSIPISQPAFFVNGTGGVVSSAADMAQWLLFHQTGGIGKDEVRLLSETNMKLMHQASAPDGVYGFGWIDGGAPESPRFFHSGWTTTFTAYQSVSLSGKHSFAVLSNGARTFIRGSGASYVQYGVQAVESGKSPTSYGESTFDLDVAFGVTGLLFLVFVSLVVPRSRRWAEAAVRRPLWNTISRLVPWGITLVVIISIPKIGGDMVGGREVAWSTVTETSMWVWLFYVSPLGLVWCATLALGCALVLTSRLMHITRLSRLSAEGA